MATETQEPPSIVDAMGGRLGMVESVVPATAFVVAYTASGQDTTVAAIVALALAGALSLARLVRGSTVQYALSGAAGVGLAAFIATRTGRAEDFFLPGLLMNVAYATAFLVSIVVRRPLLGLFAQVTTQRDGSWRQDPVQVRAYTKASWVWVGLFGARLAVQLPLYLAGEVVVLGVARVAMGVPLFAVAIWLSYLLLRGRVDALPGRFSGS